MRLLTIKLYRAFPELDRFSDEQCQRFIKATGRGWRRWLHVFIVGLLGLLGVVGAIALMAYLTKDALRGRELAEVAAFSAAIAIGPLVAIVARDLLLRLRVRRVLRNRSGCMGCGYSLLGLAVSAGNIVLCPECGVGTEVDSSLGELTLDEEGRARFKPASRFVREPRIFTARRVKVIKRMLKVSVLLVLIGGPMMWGVYEVWLERQTQKAKADRVPAQKVLDMVEAVQPVPLDSAPNAWKLFASLQAAMDQSDANVDAVSVNATSGPSNWRITADYTHIYYPVDEELVSQQNATSEQREMWRKEEALAREHLAAYRAGGLLQKLREMAAAPIAVAAMDVRPNMPLGLSLQTELGRIRNLARMNAARMKIAQDERNLDEAVQAYEELLAFSRMCRTQAWLINDLVGISVEAVGAARLRPILMSHPDEQVLDKIEEAMKRQLTSLPKDRAFKVETMANLDLIAFAFSDKRGTRFGRFSKNPMSAWSAMPDSSLPLGTYAENRAAIERYCTAFEKLAVMERWQRPMPYPERPSHLRLLDQNAPSLEKALQSMDHNELDRRGLRTMIALERYYARHQEYPPTLAELVPDLLKDPPLDPWSGKPLCYRKVDATKDVQGRGYLLYSVGGDGLNDGGVPATKGMEPQSLGASGPRGTDYILNDLKR